MLMWALSAPAGTSPEVQAEGDVLGDVPVVRGTLVVRGRLVVDPVVLGGLDVVEVEPDEE